MKYKGNQERFDSWRLRLRSKAKLGWLILPIMAVACSPNKVSMSEPESVESSEMALTEESAEEPSATPATTEVVTATAVGILPIAVDAGASSKRTVWVLMKDKATFNQVATSKDWKVRGKGVHEALVNTANVSQSSLSTVLSQKGIKHRSFWIVNVMKVEADQATIQQIAQRSDVAQIIEDRKFSIPPYQPGTAMSRPSAVEWGVNNIHAPEVWSTFGVKGEGIVIANIDTGVEYTHPALARQYRGTLNDGTFDHNYNWYDPSSTCGKPMTSPCDNAGHGTHTMGTMVGDDGDPGMNQIGVAPHARWIAAKGCESDQCSFESLIASAQWILAPTDLNGQNPRPELRPNIVNNSWGGGSGDTFFQGIVQAWVSAGIFPAFSNGNSGPSCGSANSPGDYPESYSAGAYDEKLTMASWSSRGPSVFGLIKPNLSAPGVNVRSSVPGGNYEFFSGTSMASPHLSGTVALMWAAAPALVGDIVSTRTILDQSAADTDDLSCGGDSGNNNVWGQGRLDAFTAVSLSPVGPSGTLQGTVLDTNNRAVPGATILISGGSRDRIVAVAVDGSFQTRLSVGTYTLTAKAFGYFDVVAANIVITQDSVTIQNFIMELAPSFRLTGTVSSTAGGPMAGAVVSIVGTPLPQVTADDHGQYVFPSVPVGTYQVRAQGTACYESQISILVLAADSTLDFALPQRVDGYGYSCLPVPYSYIDASTVLPINMFKSVAEVSLPFPFTLYGQTYEKMSVAANGYLSFLPFLYNQFLNFPIPNPSEPNAAIYPFWGILGVDLDSSVRTQLLGAAPNRQFVIEWRNVISYESGGRTSFEVILNEDGHIQMQYPSGGDPWQQGQRATIGIENESGTTAFQYSYNQASVTPQSAVQYSLPPSGIIQGRIKDANDQAAIAGATIQALQGSTVVRIATATSSGFYRLLLPAGNYTIVVSKKNYTQVEVAVSVSLNVTQEKDFALKTGVATLNQANLQLLMPIGQTRTRVLTLKNTGSTALGFSLAESGGRKVNIIPTRTLARTLTFNSKAFTTKGLYSGNNPRITVGIDATGDVLKSFVPANMQLPWGVGVTSHLWLSDAMANNNVEFTTDGVATGLSWPTPWAGGWAADMAYDNGRGVVCQLAVGGDNGIHCWTPGTGVESGGIAGSFPWTATSQRGLAYREDDDSFYVGGWNEGVIYHIKGLGAADKGTVIGSCRPADGAISGLAYNSAAGVLWVATNSPTDTIYEINPDDCTIVSVLAHPTPGYAGAGLDMDLDGNLWMINQAGRTAFLMDSGVPAFSDVPWLTPAPLSGTVKPGKSTNISVKVDTTGLAAGTYLATLYLQTTAAKQSFIKVPVSLVVTAYQQGVVAGGSAYVDKSGDTWAADHSYTKGSWGYVQKSKTNSTRKNISGTNEQPLFKSQRIDPYAYRYDKVPNGIYQVELNFAELAGVKMGKRLFDVIVENTQVLPAHDIVYEVGALAADKHVFFIEVTDGQMDVRFIPRLGFELPVINSLRVTHRPDR